MKESNAELQPWEIQQLQSYKDRWYESHYSIIYIPPGEVPQHKGAWTSDEFVVQMLEGLKAEYPAETVLIVVSSRCGEIHPQDAGEWLQMRQVMIECAEEEEAYIAAGKCSQCGACSLKQATSMCRPSPVGDTGDYSCDGEELWQDERDAEDASDGEKEPNQ